MTGVDIELVCTLTGRPGRTLGGVDRFRTGSMFLAYTPEQQALRAELRAYFAGLLTPEVRAELGEPGEGGEAFRRVVRQMGADGWLGIGWPKEYGGQGRPRHRPVHLLRRGAAGRRAVPVRHPQHRRARRSCAFGTDEQKARFLPGHPRAARSTSPSATPSPRRAPTSPRCAPGPSATATSTSINGNKIFTSGANHADYVWLAVPHRPRRAEAQGHLDHPRADRRRRASRARRSSPSAAPSRPPPTTTTCGCPVANRGRRRERGLAADHHPAQPRARRPRRPRRPGPPALRRRRRRGPRHRLGTGGTMLDLPWVQPTSPARHARLEAMKLLNWRMATDGRRRHARARPTSSAVKVYGTETLVDVYRTAARHPRRRRLPAARARPARCCGASSSGPAARRRSTPSAAA